MKHLHWAIQLAQENVVLDQTWTTGLMLFIN